MSEYKKIVFLDIDGVLASIPYLCTGKGFVDPEKCKLLNQLGDIGVEVVISSSWGYDEGRTEKTLRECGLTLPIVGYTKPLHWKYDDWVCRGNEIEEYINDKFKSSTKFGYSCDDGMPYYRRHCHENDIDYEFVIFDDDTDFLLSQKYNLIHTDEQTGITQKDINKAIKILTRKRDWIWKLRNNLLYLYKKIKWQLWKKKKKQSR